MAPGQILSSVLNLFFPSRCRLCGEFLEQITRVPVCAACWSAVVPLPAGGLCSVCGIPTSGEVCGECLQHPPHFDLARSFGEYRGNLRELIHLLKYQGMTPLAGPLASRMAEAACTPPWKECQAVVALPLDPARRRERGYNQAELLARTLARHVSLPLIPACRRVRPTAPQAGLSRPERHKNVRNAFAADKRTVSGLVILLVDDVMTTGATLDSCAAALRDAGASAVFGLTAARTLVTSG